MTARLQRIAGSAAAAAATLMLLAGPVFADGYKRGSLKDAPKPEERCKHSANVALTTEYVFRGISQTKEGPAIQGGYDLTCGIFYAGVWASNLDWGGTGLFGLRATPSPTSRWTGTWASSRSPARSPGTSA